MNFGESRRPVIQAVLFVVFEVFVAAFVINTIWEYVKGWTW